MTNPSRRLSVRCSTGVFSLASLLSPFSAVRAQALPDPKPPVLEQSVNASIRPGDDFFGYANGSWLKSTVIPAGKERWGPREELSALTRNQVMQLFNDARTAPAGSVGRKVEDYRAAWLNESAIEAKGLTPLKPALDSIARAHDRTALAQLLGRSVRADVDPLNWAVYPSASVVGLSVEQSIHGEKQYVAFLLQGGLGLPDRDNYLGTDPRMHSLRGEYQAYIARMLMLAGFDRAAERAAAVMSLETALAQRQATRAQTANDRNADTVWTRAEFARRAPGMDWPAFFGAAELGRVAEFGVWQPTAMIGLAELVASQPLPVWQDYLRFHLLDQHADVLPRAFAEAAIALHATIGGVQPATRAERALAATQFAMSDAIGRMYAERYFPAAQKARLRTVVANVAAAFRQRVEKATWMTPATRTLALAKLNVLYVGVAYPERWPSASDLVINPTDAIGNLRRVADRSYRLALAKLGQPVEGTEWWVAPQAVGGILAFQQNAYEVSAAILQPPKFDATASDAAAYGAIGAIIGHDISHFIDLLGAEYQPDGAMRPWWTAADRAAFDKLTAPLDSQFAGYHPFPDASINGKLTESENVADLAGLTAAFEAYRLTLGARINDREYVLRHDREFFIAFAQSYRVKLSDTGMRQQLTNDHAPEMYRVSTVRNFDAWYDAFGVVPGDKLYLAPAARVRIW